MPRCGASEFFFQIPLFLRKPLSLLNVKFPIFTNPAVTQQEYKENKRDDTWEDATWEDTRKQDTA